MNKGKLIVLSGPSGTGKSTVLSYLFNMRSDIAFSVSATTRSPRPGEKDGINYYFVTQEKFNEMVRDGELLEHATFVGNSYGTPKSPILQNMKCGINTILDIEVQGAAQVKKAMPEAVLIFIAPPSLAELEKRLRNRGTEKEEVILKRLETAKIEMAESSKYDYLVINDVAEKAAADISDIIDKT